MSARADDLADPARWLRYAIDDVLLAERLVADADLAPRLACAHAQQAAEKAIKAVLVYEQVDFPKTHDLDALMLSVPDGWQIKASGADRSMLTQWAVEARYPGDWPDATAEEAREAVEGARLVIDAAIEDLASRGIEPSGEQSGAG